MSRIRAAIRMTDDELAAFLEEPNKLQLGTINRDGTPHLSAMYYAMIDGRIGFWTYRTSQKAVNLLRDPRATCMVETGWDYEELRGASLTGTIETVTEIADVLAIGRVVYGRYLPPDPDGNMEPFLADQATKRHAYLLTPSKVASWDHTKLAAAYAGTAS